MEQPILQAALAGLLHDIGKFAQRAGVLDGSHAEIGARLIAQWQEWLPAGIQQDVKAAVERHSKPGQALTRLHKIAQVADRLASGEGPRSDVLQSDAAQIPLVPILSRVRLTTEKTGEQWGYGLKATSKQHAVLFPQATAQVSRDAYGNLWQGFARDLELLKKSGPVADTLRFTTLLSLLRKYLWCIPAATPSQDEDDYILPDVSLYDHLKVTAAIATCLEAGLGDDDLNTVHQTGTSSAAPVAVMVRGDFSGIQSFIYRITRPEAEAEFEHVAKRLRGRSFYLGLLGEVVTDYLIRTMGLSTANVLFAGGGRFDVLIPLGDASMQALDEAQSRLDEWLLQEFTGDLGLQIATAPVRPVDFSDMRGVYEELDMRLEASKQRKWERYLLNESFHVSEANEYHACQVCHTTPLPDTGICRRCHYHAELGRKLPHTTHLAFVYSDVTLRAGVWLPEFRTALGVNVGLLDEDETKSLLAELGRARGPQPEAMLYRINESDFLRDDAPAGLGLAFRFLANAAPIARQTLKASGLEPVGDDDVLHFEAIAHLSTGAERLGVLKADVDRLGTIFGEGLSTDHDRPTIARLSALSGVTDVFFSGWLNELCEELSREWVAAQASLSANDRHPWADQVDGLFYVMYAGGDDMLIVGPWDAVLGLAERLNDRWVEYGCLNPNVTLSAGYTPVKPRYPVQRFAHEVNEALDEAKRAGRDRISAFGRAVRWANEERNFGELMQLARDLRIEVESGHVPRTLVHDLGRLERQHRDPSARGKLKPMWTPRLYYTLARRVAQEVRERLAPRLLKAMTDISLPVSYVSLITRKE